MAYIENTKYNTLPEQWMSVKFDLFNNATTEQLELNQRHLKLSMSIQTQKAGFDDWQSFRAGLNLEPRFIYRGTNTENHNPKHYSLVRKLHDEIRSELEPERINISKFYRAGQKSSPLLNVSCCVALSQDEWFVWIIRNQDIYCFNLTDNLTPKQTKNNIIATNFISRITAGKNYLLPEDLGI